MEAEPSPGLIASLERIVQRLPAGFIGLILLVAFVLWLITDLSMSRISATTEFAKTCLQIIGAR